LLVVRKKKNFVSHQTLVFYFLKSVAAARASPPALFDTGDDDPDGPLVAGARASPPALLDTGDDDPDGPPSVLDGVFSRCSML
jgi:hypothetical protein